MLHLVTGKQKLAVHGEAILADKMHTTLQNPLHKITSAAFQPIRCTHTTTECASHIRDVTAHTHKENELYSELCAMLSHL